MRNKKKVRKLRRISRKVGFKELNKEIHDIEKWAHERKRFFKKLGWVIVLITLLIIFSNLYLKVTGIGI